MYAWELRISGGGGGLFYFEARPTARQCQQRVAAACGDGYTLRQVECPDGVCYDAPGH